MEAPAAEAPSREQQCSWRRCCHHCRRHSTRILVTVLEQQPAFVAGAQQCLEVPGEAEEPHLEPLLGQLTKGLPNLLVLVRIRAQRQRVVGQVTPVAPTFDAGEAGSCLSTGTTMGQGVRKFTAGGGFQLSGFRASGVPGGQRGAGHGAAAGCDRWKSRTLLLDGGVVTFDKAAPGK